MTKTPHHYTVDLNWTGNLGFGTDGYASYARDHTLSRAGKMHQINGSADPAFRGDAARWNPEETLIASIAACHKLWYLHLCCDAGITVTDYSDRATGQMSENPDGSGQFDWVHLHPTVTITPTGDAALAETLHGNVGDMCFIARSVNFTVKHTATIKVAQ